jgi:hypothetical protein
MKTGTFSICAARRSGAESPHACRVRPKAFYEACHVRPNTFYEACRVRLKAFYADSRDAEKAEC